MAEETEKIYCYDRPNNDGLLAALAMKNSQDPNALTAMMANGGMNNWMNNPFAYMMFMSLFNGGFGSWGNRGAGSALAGADAAMSATTLAQTNNLATQMQNVSNQMQDNHNADLINGNIAKTQSQLGDINLGMIGGFANQAQEINGVKSEVQSAGCAVKSAVEAQGYENRLANCSQTNTILQQSQGLQNSIANGFTALGYQLERNACNVKETSTANTQKIVDTLNNHWNLEQQTTIQQLRDEVGRLNQTNALIAALSNNTAAAAAVSKTSSVAG